LSGKRKLGIIVVICLITTLAYVPVLFNFFCGDDFVHLTWLKEAVHNAELVWRNFHSSWLDGTTTRFYRPLISVFMVTDYLGWGTNGLGFHITNVLFLVASTAILFLIVSELQAKTDEDYSILWPVGAAALFGLYPLHAEAVAWITGRVDDIVTTFYLLSLWCYIRWRRAGRVLFLGGALSGMILGLLSKEMAITLPAAFVAFDFFVHSESKQSAGLVATAFNSLKPTIPFWALLVVYFIVRRLALGTFVGGYDDSLFFISNMSAFIQGWVHGLHMMLVPVNRTLMGNHNVFTIAWEVSMAIAALLMARNILSNRGLLRRAAFLASWLVFCLAPVYKIFAIADDLQGSRLAFLATVPLCSLLAIGFALAGRPRQGSDERIAGPLFMLTRATLLVLLLLAFFLNWRNNSVWADAGREANAIRDGLDKFYEKTPGDPQVLIVGLPDESHGAYITRNALWGMTKKPQMSKDIVNCLMVNQFEPIFPFGYVKDSLLHEKERVKILRWDESAKQFEQLVPDKDANEQPTRWSNDSLKRILKVDSGSQASEQWNSDGTLTVAATSRRRPEVDIENIKVPCATTDFIKVTLDIKGASDASGADLLYKNALAKDFNLRDRTHVEIKEGESPSSLLFTLRNAPSWVLGDQSDGFKLRLPTGSTTTIKSIEIVKAPSLMPMISFENSDFMGSKGFIHMTQEHKSQKIMFDAKQIPGACGIILEVTRPNLLFASQNTAEKSTVLMDKEIKSSATTGSIELTRDFFPQLGMYEARAWAVDAQGKRIGVAGDHVVISVDS